MLYILLGGIGQFHVLLLKLSRHLLGLVDSDDPSREIIGDAYDGILQCGQIRDSIDIQSVLLLRASDDEKSDKQQRA